MDYHPLRFDGAAAPMQEERKMKRVKFACLSQTIHFELNEKLPHQEAVRQARESLLRYKRELDQKQVPYVVDGESALEDGTPVLEIRKQYTQYKVGSYLD